MIFINKLYKKYYGKNKISNIITCILVSLILVFSVLLYKQYYPDKYLDLKNKVFNETFNFMDFKNIYNKISGNKESITVSLEPISYIKKEKYKDGKMYTINGLQNINSFSDGIVVFKGFKEGYNNMVIIQGVDGFDIWYGNLDNINVDIYDYVKAGNLLGNAEDKFYLVVMKDSKYYDASEYQNYL